VLAAGAAFMEDLEAEASMVEAAFTEDLAGEAFVAGMAAGAPMEASGGTAGMGVAATMGGMEASIEASGGTAASGIPTSALASALVSTPGPIGPDRITVTTGIPIIRTPGAILTPLIPATRMVTASTPTVRI